MVSSLGKRELDNRLPFLYTITIMRTPSPRDLQVVHNRLIRLYNISAEKKLEEVFYDFIASIGIHTESNEFEELTNGGGVLSSEEMIKVIEGMAEKLDKPQ